MTTERESAEVAFNTLREAKHDLAHGMWVQGYREGTMKRLLDDYDAALDSLQAACDTYAGQAVSARLERDDALHRAGRLSEELRNSQAKVSRTRQLADALMTVIEEAAATSVRDPELAEILRDTLRKAEARRTALDSEGVEAQAKVRAGKSGEGSPAAPTPPNEALAVIQAELKEAREEMQAASATANIRTTVLLGRAERAEAKLGEPCPWCGGRRDEFPRLQQPEPTPPKETPDE